MPVAFFNQTHYTFPLDMNEETPKPRKPYTVSSAALEARKNAAKKATTASAKARRGKAPGGATTKDMVTLKVAPLTLEEVDKRKKPGESRPQFVHRAVMAMKPAAARKPKPNA